MLTQISPDTTVYFFEQVVTGAPVQVADGLADVVVALVVVDDFVAQVKCVVSTESARRICLICA